MERKLTTTRLADGKFEKKGGGRKGRKEKGRRKERLSREGKCLEEEGVRGGGRR